MWCSIGLGTTRLYDATRHYFAWYLLNVLEMPDHVVARQLRHDDGGTLVRESWDISQEKGPVKGILRMSKTKDHTRTAMEKTLANIVTLVEA